MCVSTEGYRGTSNGCAEGASQGIAAVAHVEVDPKRLDAQQYVEAGAYSYIVFTPIAERPDPCEEMRERFKKRSKG
jgi:hypothetical protein